MKSNMKKLTRQEIDEIISATPGSARVLAAVAIGEAAPPESEAGQTRHVAAVEVATTYQKLVGKGPLLMRLTLVRLSVMADNFFEKYPEGDPESTTTREE